MPDDPSGSGSAPDEAHYEDLSDWGLEDADEEAMLAAQTEGPQPFDFALALMHKDVRLATQLGADSAAPMFVANVVRELHQASLAHLGREADVTELLRTVERNADVKVMP